MDKENPYLVPMVLDITLSMNIERVRHLIMLYDQLGGKLGGRRTTDHSDVLRSAVVFLHASFEQVLRELARQRLPLADENTLNEIPLLGISETGRAEKFLLGRIAKHRGKTVDTLIKESIESYLSYLSINNQADITNLLMRCGIPPRIVAHTLQPISDMMKRRHLIVHQADRNSRRGTGHYPTQSLSKYQVEIWIGAVERFVKAISNHVLSKNKK